MLDEKICGALPSYKQSDDNQLKSDKSTNCDLFIALRSTAISHYSSKCIIG